MNKEGRETSLADLRADLLVRVSRKCQLDSLLNVQTIYVLGRIRDCLSHHKVLCAKPGRGLDNTASGAAHEFLSGR